MFVRTIGMSTVHEERSDDVDMTVRTSEMERG